MNGIIELIANHPNWLISGLIYILAGIVAGETEQIMNDLGGFGIRNGTWFPNWDWWNCNNWKYKNPIIQWLMRYPLSFLKDGYHFTGSAYRVLIIIATAVLFGADFTYTIYAVLFGYILFGTAFNYSYHN
jgi:hypothetical protein